MNDNFLIVGLGASAGGIKAFKRFFEGVRPDSGAAFVVILHLSPDHDSQLAEVLQTSAAIPVSQVRDRTRLEPDRAYVIPPNRSLSIADGCLVVSELTRIEERRAPVDIFFRTLADTHGPRAASVVLSGTGANGSMGMKWIKESGGVCLVQDPEEAEYDDMPRHAIATTMADYVLPVAEMPARLAQYDARRLGLALTGATDTAAGAEEPLRQIFTLLRIRTGHDFSSYKPGTVLRRIARRMGVLAVDSLAEYAAALRERPDEARALLKDLLISVTHFFRDRAAFEAVMAEFVTRLAAPADADQPARVWVPACATGEEAYTLAMLLAEQVGDGGGRGFQIFATDIDLDALAVARAGRYTVNDAADVPAPRLARFFQVEPGGFRVRKELREHVLFAPQNVLKDAPFSRLDLVACRNLLIYLNRSAQRRVLEVLHFALNPGGLLFLGSSESVEVAGDLFSPLDTQASLFQRRATDARAALPAVDLATPLRPAPDAAAAAGDAGARRRPPAAFGDLHHRMLEAYSPPSLIVNEDHDVVHLSERVGRYLQLPGGEPSYQLLSAVRPELRIELRSALYQAAQTHGPVETAWVPMAILGPGVSVRATVRPMPQQRDPDRGFLLVLFQEQGADSPIPAPAPRAADPSALQIEEELVRVKSQLRLTVEQYETQAEELTASNEELQAMNEELRSSAEELETGKEELQSVNEELITVNQELKVKVEEQAQATSDIQNLITAAEMGTIFLDRDLRIKLFTPRARDIFKLIPGDLGRPITDISSAALDVDLTGDMTRVLATLEPVDREVETEQGEWYALRILPYRTAEDRIDGVVVTFANVSRRKQAEIAQRSLTARLATEQQRLSAILDRLPVGVLVLDDAGAVHFGNPEAARLLGVPPGGGWPADLTAPGWTMLDVATGRELADQSLPIARAMSGETVHDERARIGRGAGSRVVSVSAVRVTTAPGEPPVTVATMQDVAAERRAAEQLHDVAQQLQTLADIVPDLLWSMNTQGQAEWFSGRWLDYTGQSHREALDSGWFSALHPDERGAAWRAVEAALRTSEELRLEHRLRAADGSYRWFLIRARPQRDSGGAVLRWLGAAVDYHEIRQAEEQSRSSETQLRLVVESVTDYAIVTIDPQGRVTAWNSGAARTFGYSELEAVGAPAPRLIVKDAGGVAAAVTDELETARFQGSSTDEGWHLRRDGSRFYASGTVYALRDAAGALTGYVKIARDLTRRKEMEDSLQRAHDELEMRVVDRTRELASTNETLELEVSDRRASEARVKTLLHQLVTIQEDERRRVARDLHDHLGQQLTALRLQLEGLRRSREQPETFAETLARAEKLADRIDADVDFLAWELRSSVDQVGLPGALATFVQEWSSYSGVAAEFHGSGLDGVTVPSDIATGLYRIAQEALNNVAKHAHCQRVDVLLEHRDGQLTLIVEDDGEGFEPDGHATDDPRGQGLVSMHERAALMGGTLEIESTPGDGTTLFARVALAGA